MAHTLQAAMLQEFEAQLAKEERSRQTIGKYLRDVEAFVRTVGIGGEVTKETVVQYKKGLTARYAPSSVNSMLAAINRFLKNLGWYDCVVKALRIQREAFRARERELTKAEYLRLLETARRQKKQRLYLLMETLGSTGIRVGELQYITTEAAAAGCATVSLKRKTRQVLLPQALCKKLLQYSKKQGIARGSIFVTRTGRAMDRSNILHEMKALCQAAGVDRRKVFPHNFRHLFACIFYQRHKDLSRLADLLGHSNINTTRIYTCVSGAEHARQIERLGLLL